MKPVPRLPPRTPSYTGKCLCQSIRYEVSAPAEWPHYCCCDDCQKWSGAPTVAWVNFPQSAFTLHDEHLLLKKYRTSSIGQRAFCSACGSSLFYIDDDGKLISLVITSLDRPNLHRPESVSYKSMAPRWFSPPSCNS
jgi:hypothetical protein